MSDDTVHHEQKVMEFDFQFPINPPNKNLDHLHNDIKAQIGLPNDASIDYLFKLVSSLCDPYTQPEESEDTILSLDCISDLVLALTYSKYVQDNRSMIREDKIEVESIKFDISIQMFRLLRLLNGFFKAEDELTTRYVNNDEEHWQENLKLWTPNSLRGMKTVYLMCCVLILAIYKLFHPEGDFSGSSYNLMNNPYLHYFLKIWKCHTNIILLGLEIDRRIEFNNHENGESAQTPEIVKQVLKGSSSIRYVLSWIINQNPSSFYDDDFEEIHQFENHDLKNESLVNFIQPIVRKKINGGSLSIDMRLVIIGLLIYNCGISFSSGKFDCHDQPSKNEDEAARRLNRSKPITELGDILIDLEYDDRFDEDIRYIFEYEYDDWEDEDDEEENVDVQPNPIGDETPSISISNVDGEVDVKSDINGEVKSDGGAIRSSDSLSIEFDEFGRDWRDLPRGENDQYSDWFISKIVEFDLLQDKEESNDFFTTWTELYETFEFLSTTSIEGDLEAEKKVGQVLINTIAQAVKNEIEKKKSGDSSITPDKIYQYWFSSASEDAIQVTQENNKLIVPILNITKFEIFLHNNNKLVRCLMDEMLMCNGYRRVLIWFLTHNVNLSTLLIDYVFELLVGLRGDPKRQSPYKFSRKGKKLVLSEIEQSMLLHEFLTNSSIYLSSTEGIEIENGYKVVLAESIAMKYMSLMCLMINQLINLGIIDLERMNKEEKAEDDIHDYRNELRILLISWIGKLPEARQLYFKIKNSEGDEKELEPNNEPQLTCEVPERLLEFYCSMSTSEIADDLDSNSAHMKTIDLFVRGLEECINLMLGKDPKSSVFDLKDTHTYFRFFFDHFNTLCKIEYIAEYLFDKFESIISTGQLTKPVGLSMPVEPQNEQPKKKKKNKKAKKKKK